MRNLNEVVKIGLICSCIIIYIVLLIYISSIQSDYNVVIQTESDVYEFSMYMQENYTIPVEVKNRSNRLLSSKEGSDILLSYHLYDAKGNLLVYDNLRSKLKNDIFSWSKDEVDLKITPVEKGEYIIKVDLVEEYVTWFSEHENIEREIKIIVK